MKRGHLIDDYNDDMNSDDYLNYYDSYAEEEEQYNENGGENCVGFFELMEGHAIYYASTEEDMRIEKDRERQELDGCWRYNKSEWDKAHPEVNKKATQKYYENNKEEINEKRRLIYAKNVEKMNEKQRLKYAKNKEAKREAAKERMKKYRQKLKEQQQ